jgi:hypothetical protein
VDKFFEELKELCRKHSVVLETSTGTDAVIAVKVKPREFEKRHNLEIDEDRI